MAYATRSLCQELIDAHGIRNINVDTSRVEKIISPLLSNTASGRVNQFEVKSRLEGLVEKCKILNNDALGDALQSRLQDLSAVSNKWTPEFLSFLLHLSDRPVQKTKVEDLIILQPKATSSLLTWQDIIQEDPSEDETAIWRDIDFAADGSDEDKDYASGSFQSLDNNDGLQDSWTGDSELDLEGLIVAVDSDAYQTVSEAQNWREKDTYRGSHDASESEATHQVTERMIIREIVFMLHELPTSMFDEDRHGDYSVRGTIELPNVTQESLSDLLDRFLALGQQLRVIRRWIKENDRDPLEQSFQSALETRLWIFHSTLDKLQTKTLDHADTGILSLLSLYDHVRSASRLLTQLHDIHKALELVEEAQRPFEILQSLYDQTCARQSEGDDEGYEYMARIFFQCFQTYLKHMRAWMETGEIGAQSMLFIARAIDEVSLPALWQAQHRVLYNADGTLKAPRFLHVAAKRILNTGKSVDFLKKLGFDRPSRVSGSSTEPQISYETVCLTNDPRNLSPFHELFDIALEAWIANKYRSASSDLRDQLELRCGLGRSLTALGYIYFYRNGSLSNSIMYPLFERVERAKKHWNDALSATELFHEGLACVECVDLNRLGACPSLPAALSTSKQRSMDILGSLTVSYTVPWPVANILQPPSMSTYQRIFLLLAQISRAKYLLERPKLPPNAPRSFYAVHSSLLWFVNILWTHLTTLVIDSNTSQMRRDLSRADDVDAMIAVHAAYIETLRDQCFLTKQHISLHQALVSILDLTVLFSDVHTAFGIRATNTENRDVDLGESAPSSDEGDDANGKVGSVGKFDSHPNEKLTQIHNTYTQLLKIVAATVDGISKTNGGSTWEILAGNLAFGVMR